MARLSALIRLRFRLDLRAILRARERGLGLLLVLPGLLLFSLAASAFVFFGVRSFEGQWPEELLPLLSAAATLLGAFWALSPVLTGVALSETHDVGRLLHFPIPPATLVASSLLSNLAQPAVLAELPVVLALALAVSESWAALPLVIFGILLSFAFILASSHAVGLLLHGIARNRRFQDIALSLGLAVSFLISLLPFLLLAGGAGPLLRVVHLLGATDAFAASPFAWGVRAAVHAGRGELVSFVAFGAAGAVAILAVVAGSALLTQRIYRGELSLSPPMDPARSRARMVFRGGLGALLEKDLRLAWREPALKAMLFMGLLGPLVFLVILSQTSGLGRSGGGLLLLATFTGASSIGANVFGLERRGIGSLLGFPVARWRVLVAKNLSLAILRLPGLLALGLVGSFLAPLHYLPAAGTLALVTLLIALAADNYLSILFPTPVPGAGQNPHGGAAAGVRGLGGALLGAGLFAATLLVASPFAFLAWLPLLLGVPGLWWASLPLALAGATAVYAMLVAGAASLMSRREPEMIERILGEW